MHVQAYALSLEFLKEEEVEEDGEEKDGRRGGGRVRGRRRRKDDVGKGKDKNLNTY